MVLSVIYNPPQPEFKKHCLAQSSRYVPCTHGFTVPGSCDYLVQPTLGRSAKSLGINDVKEDTVNIDRRRRHTWYFFVQDQSLITQLATTRQRFLPNLPE